MYNELKRGDNMLLIETEYGNFGNFNDLYTFMQHEGVEKVKAKTSYISNEINTLTLTIDDVWKIATDNV